jgi:hypothetical protein
MISYTLYLYMKDLPVFHPCCEQETNIVFFDIPAFYILIGVLFLKVNFQLFLSYHYI